MRRPTSAWTTAILGTALTASTLSAQQVPTAASATVPGQAVTPTASPAPAGRGARYVLRNGWDYLKLRQYDRALALFREAEKHKQGLSPDEQRSLQQGMDGARRGLREVSAGTVAVSSAAKVAVSSSAPTPVDNTVQRTEVGAAAPASPSAVPSQQPPVAVELAAAPVVVASSAPAAEPAPQPAAVVNAAEVPLPPLSAEAPNPAPAPPVAASVPSTPREPASTPAESDAAPAAPESDSLPPLPDSPALPAAPPVAPPTTDRDVRETAQTTERPAPVPVPEPVPPLPDSLPSAPESALAPGVSSPPMVAPEPPQVAVAPETPAASAEPTPAIVAAPAAAAVPASAPESTPMPEPTSAPAVVPGPAVDPTPAPPAESFARPAEPTPAPAAASEPASTPAPDEAAAEASALPEARLRPELRRQVDEIALQQEEEAKRRGQQPQGRPAPESGPLPGSPASRLELTRAPSPTEARPIRAIPVPEEFVPLPKRDWAPNRKMWAAAATAHYPLYFQDASLERYGHSTEQFVGPIGRYLTYPLDDPRQSNQRNQLTQWIFSYGLFAAQIVALPYNLVMDPPWECEYDLGYYRPGDQIPTDLYYLPVTGIGPPLRGARY